MLEKPLPSEYYLSPEPELEKPGFDPSDAVEFWDLINRQDWAICEEVQRGLSSRDHRFGYYAPMEDASLDIRRYVLERPGTGSGLEPSEFETPIR